VLEELCVMLCGYVCDPKTLSGGQSKKEDWHCQKLPEIVFQDGKIWTMAPSQQWKWWRKPSDGWLAVKICIPELSSDNCACDTTQYILSNIYDFTLFILSMMVILIAVYAVVLVLLKDQWWYMWAVRAMNQEVVEVWWVAAQCAPKWGKHKCHWTWIKTHPASSKRSFLFSLSVQNHLPLLFAVDIHFHSTYLIRSCTI